MNILETIFISSVGGLIGGYISYYFSEKTENYKFELLKIEQSAKVAELFAFWIRQDDVSINMLEGDKRKRYIENLNKLTWELAIWIKDEDMVIEIMDRLQNVTNAKDIKEIVLDVREYIHKTPNRKLKLENITHFH